MVAAGVAGVALGGSSFAAGALLLYGGDGFLTSAGFIAGVALASTGAGVWVGAPDGPAPGHRRVLGRWTFAIVALVIASFVATFWLRSPEIQAAEWAGPIVMVLLLAEPAYALGALAGALESRRRGAIRAVPRERRSGGRDWPVIGGTSAVVVPILLGTGLGAALAGAWLIPAFPPGLVFLGLALLLTAAGSLEMGLAAEPKGDSMAERVVVVTGAGDRGQVGYAVAEAFARQGARVVVTARGEGIGGVALELGDDVVGVPADLADPAGAEAVVEAARSRWGRLDVLVNVAGGLHVMKPVEETTPEEWERESRANARTAFLMSQAALPLLRQSRGAIINFASPAGLRAVKGMAAYSAAKAGVVALTRALALEERDAGVRVNAIAPGLVDTAQNRESADGGRAFVSRGAVVEAVVFLAGARGVSGEVLAVTNSDVRA